MSESLHLLVFDGSDFENFVCHHVTEVATFLGLLPAQLLFCEVLSLNLNLEVREVVLESLLALKLVGYLSLLKLFLLDQNLLENFSLNLSLSRKGLLFVLELLGPLNVQFSLD